MKKFYERFLTLSNRTYFNEGAGDAGAGGEQGAGEGDSGAADGDAGSAGAGETQGKYYEAFPEDVREWDEVKNSDTPEKFWQQITDHRSHIGQSIRVPGADAGKEDWDKFNGKLAEKVPDLMRTPNPEDSDSLNTFYDRMGRPEAADNYSIPELKDNEGAVIEGLDHSMSEAFKAVAHKTGLSQKQYNEVVEGMTIMNIAEAKAHLDNVKVQQEAIATEWGAAEEQNYNILKNFARKTDAPEGLIKALDDKQVDAATAKWMLTAANATMGSKDRAIDDTTAHETAMTPSEANNKYMEIMNNKEHPYWNKMDTGHKAAITRVRELLILKDPKNATKPAPGSTTFTFGQGN